TPSAPAPTTSCCPNAVRKRSNPISCTKWVCRPTGCRRWERGFQTRPFRRIREPPKTDGSSSSTSEAEVTRLLADPVPIGNAREDSDCYLRAKLARACGQQELRIVSDIPPDLRDRTP